MRLRVLTYNIHRAIGLDRRFRPGRIVEIVDHYDPDLVLFQEVDEGVPRSRELDLARELARELGYPHYAVGHNVSLRKGRYGNATLSRFPILRERNIDLTVGGRKRRGCQHTTLLLERPGGGGRDGTVLELFNLHLGLSAWERSRQAEILARCGELADLPPETPCMIAGDFNDWRSRLRSFFQHELGLCCATDRPTQRGARAFQTYPAMSPRGGLDKIYFRGAIRLVAAHPCRLSVARRASDHLPIVADFELPG